jgi:hypothetical protein
MIGPLLVVQMPNASDMGAMAVLFRPPDCLVLRLEGGENVVRVILDDVIIDRGALGPPLGSRLNVDNRHRMPSVVLQLPLTEF